jgi:hypothetical protein
VLEHQVAQDLKVRRAPLELRVVLEALDQLANPDHQVQLDYQAILVQRDRQD